MRGVLAGARRILVDAHPSTLTSVHNVACLLLDKGDLESAGALFREAISGRRRALGDAHLNACISLASLAALLVQRGKRR